MSTIDFGQIYSDWQQCYANRAANPDTDPNGPYASTSSTVTQCTWQLPDSWEFPPATGSVRDLFACPACECPMYWSGTFDYDQLWFSYVPLALAERILNFCVVAQLMISAISVNTPLIFFAYVWYGFWSIFWLPNWWTRLFLLRDTFTTWPQVWIRRIPLTRLLAGNPLRLPPPLLLRVHAAAHSRRLGLCAVRLAGGPGVHAARRGPGGLHGAAPARAGGPAAGSPGRHAAAD